MVLQVPPEAPRPTPPPTRTARRWHECRRRRRCAGTASPRCNAALVMASVGRKIAARKSGLSGGVCSGSLRGQQAEPCH